MMIIKSLVIDFLKGKESVKYNLSVDILALYEEYIEVFYFQIVQSHRLGPNS